MPSQPFLAKPSLAMRSRAARPAAELTMEPDSAVSAHPHPSAAAARCTGVRRGAWRDNLLRALANAAVLLGLFMLIGGQAPRPRPVAIDWEFDFRPGPLRIGAVELDGQSRHYFYMTYRVVNFSGRDRPLAPSFELATDTGELLRSGAGSNVPVRVAEVLEDRLGNPLLEDEIAIVGILGQGRANAREGLVVWPVPAEGLGEIDRVRIFAAGFSGEFATYRARDPETGRFRDYQLRKTVLIEYETPGRLDVFNDRPARELSREFILR